MNDQEYRQEENQNPENCTHDCNSCGASCPSRTMSKSDFLAPPNRFSRVKKVIGVVSGKGGVGKSMVTSLLAVAANRAGKTAGILDADITGPSIPKAFGAAGQATSDGENLLPVITPDGISLMSVNLVLEDNEDPVIWRGPILAGVVKQFWTDVAWGELDVLFVDMPPGTGDVPLTVFQSLPLDGIVVVTSPQDLVSMIVEKAVRMAEKMDIPVLGLVENMAYLTCPDCGRRIEVFGPSRLQETAAAHRIENTLEIPIRPEIAALTDAGQIEDAAPEITADFSDFLSALTD